MTGQLRMGEATLPVLAIPANPDSQPYHDGLAEGRLVAPRCNQCDNVIWYPRHFCVDCGTTDVSWVDLSGEGTIYSYSVVHKTAGPYGEAAPYVLAYVELTEGPHVMTNIVGCDPADLAIDMPVRGVVETNADGESVLRFEPRD